MKIKELLLCKCTLLTVRISPFSGGQRRPREQKGVAQVVSPSKMAKKKWR